MWRDVKAVRGFRPGIGAGRLALVAILTGVVATVPGSAAGEALDEPATTGSTERATALVVRLINRERRAHGRRPLRWQPQLARPARAYSREMVARGFFSHVTPDGADFRARATATRYLRGRSAWSVGETLAWAAGAIDTPARIVAAWLASPGHRRLLLDPRFREIGVGVATGAPVADDGIPARTYAAELGVRGAAARRLLLGRRRPAAARSAAAALVGDGRSARARGRREHVRAHAHPARHGCVSAWSTDRRICRRASSGHRDRER